MTDGIKDCLPPDRHPRKPKVTLPTGSIDTHVHVFERARYAMSPSRGYTPPDSTLADLRHLHATLGIDRVVFTQPSTYGVDNSAILDGVSALNAETPNRARCVVAITLDIGDRELAALHDRGARGVRLNTDNKGGMPIGFGEIGELEARIRPFGLAHRVALPRQGHPRAHAGVQRAHLCPCRSATSPISRRRRA